MSEEEDPKTLKARTPKRRNFGAGTARQRLEQQLHARVREPVEGEVKRLEAALGPGRSKW